MISIIEKDIFNENRTGAKKKFEFMEIFITQLISKSCKYFTI